MTRPRFTIRWLMIAVAILAVGMNSLRELPALMDCYRLWQGTRRSLADLEIVNSGSGASSLAANRARINAEQTWLQAQIRWRSNLSALSSLAVFGLLCVGLLIGGSLNSFRFILRWSRQSGGQHQFVTATHQLEQE